jgi:hypothetical protein
MIDFSNIVEAAKSDAVKVVRYYTHDEDTVKILAASENSKFKRISDLASH